MPQKVSSKLVREPLDAVEIEADLESSDVTAGMTGPALTIEQRRKPQGEWNVFMADVFNEPHD